MTLLVFAAQPVTADVIAIGPGGVARLGASPSEQGVVAAPKRTPTAVNSNETVERAIIEAAAKYELSTELVRSVGMIESNLSMDARSSKGAIGVMQLMPGTAADLGVDPTDPVANIFGGAAYLRQQLDQFDGRIDLALAAYNAGPGAVQRHQGVPPFNETTQYVANALDLLSQASGPSGNE